MCTVCGCGDGTVEGHDHAHHRHDHRHDHDHDHHHHHAHGDIHCGHGPAGVSVPGMSQERLIEIETGILSQNDR
ncbi:hydrogenase nickel incorporation protein HypB [Jannaschia seohaensis]|uniref:Hydrogenase nickel incorporation protein HypB n=1 Tax=Jannaschia seohaensis TaxID=475081 RepID=A0A2Y9BVY0_9RHOB|nr:hydrogenase nickel incorporation protein HypB [Jannaschia seohaensis]SSA38122.1 hydrogenase nickel incorporation protein HypB [Jannaschia seohaensis]